MEKQKGHIIATLAVVSQLGIGAYATTGDSIVTAVDKAHVLPQGSRLRAAVDANGARVSLYQHLRANENDLKIDAVLISKAIMDLDSSITRVTVYFFDTRDMSKYRTTTVSTGDVKAFATGSVNKEELLKSLPPLQEAANVDPNLKVETAVISGFSYRLSTKLDGSKIAVSTDLDPAASDRDIKYVALQIADKALAAAPKNVSDVSVAFADPDQAGAVKAVNLSPAAVKGLDSSLDNALASISFTESNSAPIKESTKSTPEPAKTESPIVGVMAAARKKLAERIAHLPKGLQESLLTEYQALEKQVSDGADETTIGEAVKQLTEKVEQAEKEKK